jgi:PAS domain-containing protein
VTLASIGDAVITTDTKGRVTYVNAVASSLTGWTEREAIGEPLRSVFQIVDEATRPPLASPVAPALGDDGVIGLANHTVLIRRPGCDRIVRRARARSARRRGPAADAGERRRRRAADGSSEHVLTSVSRRASGPCSGIREGRRRGRDPRALKRDFLS